MITTARLILEPVTVEHAPELHLIFSDPKVHQYIASEVPTLEEQKARCARWARRTSPDGKEVWLNWLAREKGSNEPIGHFQAGFKKDRIATVGYVVASAAQGKGFATEAMSKVFAILRDEYDIREIKAFTDTRNMASQRLAKKLGMVQKELIKSAEIVKGEFADDFVFSCHFD